ncbi:succinate dehydrogenase assembly factor 2 [Reyranella sp.]|uniref:FAD assembly factor SdhE n=1 Tax=Reyranella sp. TaxID=1929291 RepID=UPI0025CF5EF1|nr:succinate dehydrogenase assembly factor 2 [Reyranella sp.]
MRTHGWLDQGLRDFAIAAAYMLRPFLFRYWGKHGRENMSADTDLETRRKRLLYRSTYRGNKENDILLGQFARAHLGEFGAAELDQYERLLAVGDNDIYDWVSGKVEVPADQDSPVVRKLLAFRVRF